MSLTLFSLFGNGNLITSVLIGGTKQPQAAQPAQAGQPAQPAKPGENPQLSINSILDRLGIKHGPEKGHHNHFHIFLKPPELVQIGGNMPPLQLQATEAPEIVWSAAESNFDTPLPNEVAMLESIILAWQLTPADFVQPPSIVKVAGSNKSDKKNYDYHLKGFCDLFESNKDISSPDGKLTFPPHVLRANVFPGLAIQWYHMSLLSQENINAGDYELDDLTNAKVTILQMPNHGQLFPTSKTESPYRGGPGYAYLPNPGFIGVDSLVALVEFNDLRIKVTMELVVVRELSDYGYSDGKSGGGSTLDEKANGCMFFVDIRFHRVGMVPGKAESSSVRQPSTPLSTLLADAVTTFQGFTDLPGLATAQTLGNQITLDTTAAGYTWYIDPTPFDNTDDFLPTADPTIWQAKPGTEAVGKMDLLSVLLHEYGHVLGLDHSSNPRDFMAASLPPGERRLPSAAELQLMADLVAQIKNDPLSPSPTEGQGEIPVLPTGQRTASQTLSRRRLETDTGNTDTRYQAAINPTLLNGDFDSATADWLAEGNITVTDNTITLNETSLVQTRLTQAFQINEGDHTLSFTLSDQHLTANSNNGPSDAFEVALLDANTGLPVTDTINLTRSDALLNIQTDGTERLAQGVSKVVNDDGSATYTIALPKTLADTPVLLSFDLLGFGLNANDIQSSISLRDIHLNDSGSGSPSDAPIAPADRNANVVAGQSFTFNPLAGASDVDGDTLTAEWITQPEHGVLEQ